MVFVIRGSTPVGDGRGKFTVDIQLVDLSLDRHLLLRLSRDELGFDGSDQPSADRVERSRKVRSVHLPGLAIRFVVYVFTPVAEGGRLARCGELVQLFGGCACEVDKPWGSKFVVWAQESCSRLLCVSHPIVKVEAFARWRDSSAAERRMVEGEGFAQGIQLGFGSHGVAPLKGPDYVYPSCRRASNPYRHNQLNDCACSPES